MRGCRSPTCPEHATIILAPERFHHDRAGLPLGSHVQVYETSSGRHAAFSCRDGARRVGSFVVENGEKRFVPESKHAAYQFHHATRSTQIAKTAFGGCH